MNASQFVELVGRMRHADLYVVVLMAVAHAAMGLDVVSAEWLRDRTTYAQGAIGTSLRKLASDAWGLVEQPIRYQWRLSAKGRQLALTLTPLLAESNPMYGGVVDHIDQSYVLTTPTPNSTLTPLLAESLPSASSGLSAESLDADTARAMRLLLRLDVWPNVARDVAGLLAGDDYVNLRDVLGWIVYCRDARNRIGNEAAVVCANLRARQRPSSRYRAAYLCGRCRRMETMCTCAAPDLYLPEEFDDLAFESAPEWGHDDWLRSLWFCSTCGGRPCVCSSTSSEGDHDER